MPLLDNLLAVIAPHSCLVCSKEGQLLCNWCTETTLLPVPSRCYRCASLTSDYSVCSKCRPKTALKHVWVRTEYDGVTKQLLHDYKFARAGAGSVPIAAAMHDVLPYLPANVLIVPVPTATIRVRQRGYDHAELLARHLSQLKYLDYSRVVSRLTQSRQVGANRQQRLHQLENAFLVVKPKQVKGADILLVDDVLTTGATLETVARLLKQAGARSVHAVVFAQKQ